MAQMKTQKNLLTSRDMYNQYYGAFRGVDFSSDHTQVDPSRFAYLVNMYRDYQSKQGDAIETIPGFRRRFLDLNRNTIYGIHTAIFGEKRHVLVHSGDKLYLWKDYPDLVNVPETKSFDLGEKENGVFRIELLADGVESVRTAFQEVSFVYSDGIVSISNSRLQEGDTVFITFHKEKHTEFLREGMNLRKSSSFIFNNRLYIIDGKNYLYYDGENIKAVAEEATIPTTHDNTVLSGTNANAGHELNPRNLLNQKFKQTYIADGVTQTYRVTLPFDSIVSVFVYGVEYPFNYDAAKGEVTIGEMTIGEIPPKPEDKGFTETYNGVEITALKRITNVGGVYIEDGTFIEGCTVCATYDNRVFFSGNPQAPNLVFWCQLEDPSYFGETGYVQCGVGEAPVTALLSVANSLMVIKADTQQDSSVYYLSPVDTESEGLPIAYTREEGLHGIGCVGPCANFLDDPVFVSRLGVEAVGQLSVRYERAIEHRSSLIDSELLNNGTLTNDTVSLAEWNGYLVLLVNGKIYLADSRQKYIHKGTGAVQYEWYYLEDIGIYNGQYERYVYSGTMDGLEGAKVNYCPFCKKATASCTNQVEHKKNWIELDIEIANGVLSSGAIAREDWTGKTANPNNEAVLIGAYNDIPYYCVVQKTAEGYRAFLCDSTQEMIGGTFSPAVIVKEIDGNLFFGTEDGVVCSFNFDKRGDDGEISPQYYDFDGRAIFCGCATKMDSCGIPHLTKSTVKNSTVIKTKAMQSTAAKIKIRTNKKPYEQIARITSTSFSFDNLDFADFSFLTTDQSLFSVKEKEKKWVEKQYFLYSDEYRKPFALYYIAFRYKVAGRYKE